MELLGEKLFIRADSSTEIGAGHVMRCLALAQAWQDAGGEAVYVSASLGAKLEERLRSEKIDLVRIESSPGSPEDARQTVEVAKKRDVNWVVVDGYHFGAEYQQAVKDADLRLLFIDDNGHVDHYYADIVLNQNIHATEDLYRNREPYTHLLLGTKYVLLRREFLKWRGWKREIPAVAKKILITMGGGDPENTTLKVIRALQQISMDGLETKVVIGWNSPHYDELKSTILESKIPIELLRDIDDMSGLMTWADVAVLAGGSTVWETAFMGLPSIVIVLAPNQYPIAEKMGEINAVLNLGWYNKVSPDVITKSIEHLSVDADYRKRLMTQSRNLVDGEGGIRVVKALIENSEI